MHVILARLLIVPGVHGADTTNKRLVSTRDELQGQKQVFKESRGLLGSLKSQSRWER